MNDEPTMNFTIVSAEYTNSSHTQALVKMKDKDNIDFPYFFCPNIDDESSIYLYLNDKQQSRQSSKHK